MVISPSGGGGRDGEKREHRCQYRRITLEGHLIDPNVLSRVMDESVSSGGQFRFVRFDLGQGVDDHSSCELEVTCDAQEQLTQLLGLISHRGAVVETEADAPPETTQADAVFPEAFYSTPQQGTFVRRDDRGSWQTVGMVTDVEPFFRELLQFLDA